VCDQRRDFSASLVDQIAVIGKPTKLDLFVKDGLLWINDVTGPDPCRWTRPARYTTSARTVRCCPAARLLRDGENHHESGVHDANGDPGEPYSWIGDVSSVVGKVSETLRSFGLDNAVRLRGCVGVPVHVHSPARVETQTSTRG
jgi:hypothetical protein